MRPWSRRADTQKAGRKRYLVVGVAVAAGLALALAGGAILLHQFGVL